MHSSKGDEKVVSLERNLGHPTTDSALTIPRIARRRALDLKDWLKWEFGERAPLAFAQIGSATTQPLEFGFQWRTFRE